MSGLRESYSHGVLCQEPIVKKIMNRLTAINHEVFFCHVFLYTSGSQGLRSSAPTKSAALKSVGIKTCQYNNTPTLVVPIPERSSLICLLQNQWI